MMLVRVLDDIHEAHVHVDEIHGHELHGSKSR